MWENRRVINCGDQLHLFVHKLGVGWEVTPAMLLKIKTVLEVRKCCLSLQHVWSVSAPIRTPIFTPHLLNPSTPKHATILHRFCPISWFKTKNVCTKCILSIEDPYPPLSTKVDTDVIHMIKWTRPFPSVFAYCKRSKTGRWEGLGTRH